MPVVLDIVGPLHGPVFLIRENKKMKLQMTFVGLQVVQQLWPVLDPDGLCLLGEVVPLVELVYDFNLRSILMALETVILSKLCFLVRMVMGVLGKALTNFFRPVKNLGVCFLWLLYLWAFLDTWACNPDPDLDPGPWP